MQRRIAIKRLTASDLTLFEWQFRNRNAGNQKSINLNSDVFIKDLFPSLPDAAAETNGRVPLDLYIYGPGHSGVHNLQRKIVKGSAYKNWRLNGEYISNPENESERYNALQPDDLAVFDFQGRVIPVSAKLLLVSRTNRADQVIHRELSLLVGGRAMVSATVAQLQAIANQLADDEHPLHDLTIDADLEDAAQSGLIGIRRLNRRTATRPLTTDEMERARRLAQETGRAGEELVSEYLLRQKANGTIQDFTWVSDANAVAPYDFLITLVDGQEIAVDVKTTRGEFNRAIHISAAELLEMHEDRRYDLYRVFEMIDDGAQLRIAEDVGSLAGPIIEMFQQLPPGVRVDSVSVDTSTITFGPPVPLLLEFSE